MNPIRQEFARPVALAGLRLTKERMQRVALLTFLVLQAGAVAAQGRPTDHVREPVPNMTTADLAAHGWRVGESTGLSLAEGGQGVVSFWERQVYGTHELMRCITAFDAMFNQVSDVCARTVHPR